MKNAILNEKLDQEAAFAEWRDRARRLAQEHKGSQWKIGDLLVGGEQKFGRKVYKEAAKIFTDWHPATLKDFAYVARQVLASARTNDLSWRHHKLVARFEPDVQRKLLAFAVRITISSESFRKHINEQYPQSKKEPKALAISVTLPPGVRASVELFAEARFQRLDETMCYLVGLALQIPEVSREISRLSEIDLSQEAA